MKELLAIQNELQTASYAISAAHAKIQRLLNVDASKQRELEHDTTVTEMERKKLISDMDARDG